jgi:hypothetical protein
MKCPQCDSEMQDGAVGIGMSAAGVWYTFLSFFTIDGVTQCPRRLLFTAAGESPQNVLSEGLQRAGHRCVKCHTLVLLDRLPDPPVPPVPPPKPPEWVVCIAEQQQNRAPRRAVYDCLRRHHVSHTTASPKANEFRGGRTVELPLQEKQRAQAILDDLRKLGLEAVVIEPAPGMKGQG